MWDPIDCWGHGPECTTQLGTIKRVNGERDPVWAPEGMCCWRCGDGFSNCPPDRYPGRIVFYNEQHFDMPPACANATSNDLARQNGMDRVLAYRLYLEYLVRAFGHGLDSRRVHLFGSEMPSDEVPGEIRMGNTYCHPFPGYNDYYIRIYIAGHMGQSRAELLDTIAHEFHHADWLNGRNCKPPDSNELAREEAAAKAFAASLRPHCP
ncbi:MAG: hypothetical protein ACM3PC_00095 [Deltaproteobacteria bacterium]